MLLFTQCDNFSSVIFAVNPWRNVLSWNIFCAVNIVTFTIVVINIVFLVPLDWFNSRNKYCSSNVLRQRTRLVTVLSLCVSYDKSATIFRSIIWNVMGAYSLWHCCWRNITVSLGSAFKPDVFLMERTETL